MDNHVKNLKKDNIDDFFRFFMIGFRELTINFSLDLTLKQNCNANLIFNYMFSKINEN